LSLEDNVVLPGALTPKEVHEQMAKASIFVQHSLTTPQSGDKEGTPVAIMEAMATGLPVISTNHAGIAEIIENGVSGILVDEFDSETMSEEMIRLFNNKQEIRQMSKSATEAIFKNNLLTDHIKILSSKLEKHIKR
jgi:glycosyltransferase involved in cell wall biosynthesis